MNILNVEKVSKTYGEKQLFDEVTLGVNKGDKIGVIGVNGTGKSTFLKIIAGLEEADAGQVVKGKGVTVAYLEQKAQFPEKDTILGYVLRGKQHSSEAEAKTILTKLGITEFDKDIHALSGGQKKRVSIAMELLASPRLLILDEPTSGLSPDLDRSMMELCRKLSHENCTVLMVTHNMSNINLCDKIAFLGTGGVLCYYGSPEAMDEYFDVELTSDIFEKLHDPEQVEYYRRKYFTSPEFNRLAARFPAAAKEAEKRCKA